MRIYVRKRLSWCCHVAFIVIISSLWKVFVTPVITYMDIVELLGVFPFVFSTSAAKFLLLLKLPCVGRKHTVSTKHGTPVSVFRTASFRSSRCGLVAIPAPPTCFKSWMPVKPPTPPTPLSALVNLVGCSEEEQYGLEYVAHKKLFDVCAQRTRQSRDRSLGFKGVAALSLPQMVNSTVNSFSNMSLCCDAGVPSGQHILAFLAPGCVPEMPYRSQRQSSLLKIKFTVWQCNGDAFLPPFFPSTVPPSLPHSLAAFTFCWELVWPHT